MYGKGRENRGTKQTGRGKKPRLGEDYGWSKWLVSGPTNSSLLCITSCLIALDPCKPPEQRGRDLKHLM